MFSDHVKGLGHFL